MSAIRKHRSHDDDTLVKFYPFLPDYSNGELSAFFNKIAIPNNKFQMASGQGSHWLIESPTIFSSMCSPPSNICQFYF